MKHLIKPLLVALVALACILASPAKAGSDGLVTNTVPAGGSFSFTIGKSFTWPTSVMGIFTNTVAVTNSMHLCTTRGGSTNSIFTTGTLTNLTAVIVIPNQVNFVDGETWVITNSYTNVNMLLYISFGTGGQ